MNINECEVGMLVRGRCCKSVFVISKVLRTVVHLELNTGDKIFNGEQWVDEIITYKNVQPRRLTKLY